MDDTVVILNIYHESEVSRSAHFDHFAGGNFAGDGDNDVMDGSSVVCELEEVLLNSNTSVN